MTVEASAIDSKTDVPVSVILLLDTGAQRSFISQEAVARLHLTVTNITPLTTVMFGGVHTTEQSGVTQATLLDDTNKKLSLTLRTKDRITISCMPYYVTYEDRRLHLLHTSHRILTAARTIVPDILIGIDYFWDIFTADHPQTLPSGLVLCYTRFGPTLSGSKFFRGLHTTTSH
ncbi:Zinc knuckle family protein [Trichostrongylus colubriformis]|uniref:Zinc knuckle family protein n=1 Tax=Trichostrongylus colubriformis TaxID=6319 RepID=A0AAN8II71_TRICO